LRLLPLGRKAFKDVAMMALNAASGLRSGDSLHLALALAAGASGLSTADGAPETGAKAKGLKVIRFRITAEA